MYTVIGFNFTTYKNKEGNDVDKTVVYATFDPLVVCPRADSFLGIGCETFVLFGNPPESLINLSVGDSFKPVYNKYGRFTDIIKI